MTAACDCYGFTHRLVRRFIQIACCISERAALDAKLTVMRKSSCCSRMFCCDVFFDLLRVLDGVFPLC